MLQIKELEDALASAQQAPAHLQAQIDTATDSAESQAIDLASAQARCSELSNELESLRSQLTQAQAEQSAAKDALLAQEALMASQEQQRDVQVGFCAACLSQ